LVDGGMDRLFLDYLYWQNRYSTGGTDRSRRILRFKIPKIKKGLQATIIGTE